MPEAVQDNRNFYRIRDEVGLAFCCTDEATATDSDADFPIDHTPQFQLLNQLHAIDSENSALLKNIAEKDRNVSAYLKLIDQKIELLAALLSAETEKADQSTRMTVSLSEGGMAFNHDQPLPEGQHIALKLTLYPSRMGLLLYGKVLECTSNKNNNYLINVAFINISEDNRALIARHVLLFQAKQRREQGNPAASSFPT